MLGGNFKVFDRVCAFSPFWLCPDWRLHRSTLVHFPVMIRSNSARPFELWISTTLPISLILLLALTIEGAHLAVLVFGNTGSREDGGKPQSCENRVAKCCPARVRRHGAIGCHLGCRKPITLTAGGFLSFAAILLPSVNQRTIRSVDDRNLSMQRNVLER